MRPRTSHDAPDTYSRAPHWGDDAECRSSKTPDHWFAEGQDAEAVADRAEAKRVCVRCPARTSCLHAALERGEPSGVWGGLDSDERAALTLLPTVREPSPSEEPAGGPPTEQAKTA
ncbi:WhiB family transcriptional regulator [Streptomyces mirabilis]|uniref:WhiB family transcriptional regulator n=1 Tax=Streptomyces mirabilis TaxID=68239 RepID=UPI0022557728|nr:WhiB family transcriptional regulator [Streptomyces mirabilis]MCX4609491.1 WhiB family transcriptional regulator [Streptomyces mirabilis]